MIRRIQLKRDPIDHNAIYGFGETQWPAKWVGPRSYDPDVSRVLVFRCAFNVKKAAKFRMHLSADQRYELYVDGEYVARGVERSDLKNWVYESYDVSLSPGKHQFVIRLWWIAAKAPAPEAQVSHAPGLLLYAEGNGNALLSTGVARWQYQDAPGYRFQDHDRLSSYFATGALLVIDGKRVKLDLERGQGVGWRDVKAVEKVAFASLRWETAPWWVMRPAFLPPAYEKVIHAGRARHVEEVATDKTQAIAVDPARNLGNEQDAWSLLLKKDRPVTVPARSARRILIDLENYYCAYPMLRCSGEGARLRLQTAESLFEVETGKRRRKGNRNEINGKVFVGVGIEIKTAKQTLTYQPHAFMAGRYIELLIRTGEKPLRVESLRFLDTHFPFRFKAKFASSDPAHSDVIPIALRTLEMCSHDTSMDCPYYERLNYVGDTRLQSLVAYVSADEDRLARKCIELFDVSRQPSGLTSSRYPTRTTQTIPTFSLWWVGMVSDFAMWRGNRAFVQDRMGGVRAVLEHWRGRLRGNGLLQGTEGWNFVDWVPAWRGGIPADGDHGFSGIINLQMIYTLRLAANLEESLGETALAGRHRDFADALAKNVTKAFFDRKAALFADDLAHKHFSEHAQCMAVLSGVVAGPAARRLVERMLATPGLSQATIYFAHYLFETLAQTGRIDALLKRLEMWNTLRSLGFRTTFEMPEPSRSDCHAWGAHPVYHFLATIAGIRPADYGFNSAIIRPQLGSLKHIEGEMPHRNGKIAFSLDSDGNGRSLRGTITLPKGLSATLEFAGRSQKLRSGKINRVDR